jgi:hypothetical protein
MTPRHPSPEGSQSGVREAAVGRHSTAASLAVCRWLRLEAVTSSESSGRVTEHPSPTQFRAGQGEPLSMVRLATICSGVFFR